jgi:moderate conductance mechanosensitive channel
MAPLTDISTWVRGSALEIVLLVLGAVLLARFATWAGRRITEHIDAASPSGDVLVRSEATKHRHAIAQVLTWLSIALIWSVTAVLVLERFGIPVTSLAAPAAVIGAALGFVHSRWCGITSLASSSSWSGSTASATWP